MRISKALLLTQSNICHMAAPAATDSGKTPATPAAPKAETVGESMDQRRVFTKVEDAAAYLNLCATTYTDFEKFPLVTRGLDDEMNFLPDVYTAGMNVLVAVLKNRGKDAKGNALPSTVKAIVVTPTPSLDSLIADAGGKQWLDSIISKELNHVAVRALRGADDVTTVADQMPTTLQQYITSQRDAGGIMETYDELFKPIIAAIAARSTPWAKARLTKPELKRSMESKAYAAEYYPQLEDRGDKPSLFVMALQFGQAVAAKKGLDPAIFDKWLANRDAAKLAATTTDGEDDDFDLDSLELIEEEPKAAEGEAAADATPAAEEVEPTEENTATAE